jgi:hypothetical protein
MSGLKMHAGELGAVVQHPLKVSCTARDAWIHSDSPVGDELGFQRTERQMITVAGAAGLPTQFGEEFRSGSLQIASLAAIP